MYDIVDKQVKETKTMCTKLIQVKIKFNVDIEENVEDTMTLEISVSHVDSITDDVLHEYLKSLH